MHIQVSIWQLHALLQIRPSRFHNSSHFASRFPPATNSCYFQLSSTICAVFKAPKPYFLPIVKKSISLPPVMRHPQSHGGSHKTSKHKNSDNTAVIAACSVAAFAFIGLFLFCCLRSRRNKAYTKDGQRDDRPLLNFCSSDISRGSSVTYNFGNSSKKDLTSSSNVNNISIGTGSSVAEGKLSTATEVPPGANHAKLPLPPGANHANLPLPPGRVPPLDPNLPLPPGRVPPPSAAPASPAPGPDIPATEPATPAPKPGPPPPPPPIKRAPPPPPKIGRPPPKGNTLKPPAGKGSSSENKETKETSESDSQKAKLKPFFWDKVLANPEQSMVWNEIKAGSFQFNEEMMEDLFGYNKVENNKEGRPKKDQKAFEAPKYIQIIDPKKAHNLSILLKATNVTTEEVCDAITEGNELPPELIETLLKMAPTSQEELKLRLYTEDISKLGPADWFIKVLVDIPFAYKRLESLLFMCSLQNETSSIKESFSVLEVACTELRNSRLFLKLLEAVLKTGNRMNDGTFRGGAQAFKLDTLLKLSDVKGTDGKTTLLHFVIQEIIRSEGIRAARRLRESSSMNSVKTEDLLDDSVQESPEYFCSLGLDVISNLSSELSNVRKAAVIDGDMLTTTATKLGLSLQASKEFLKNEMSSVDGECEFRDTLESFVEQAENDVIFMLEEEKRITSLVKSTADYFHGTPGKDEGMRLFMIVRDFLVMVDKVCQEVKKSLVNPVKAPKKEAPNASTSRESQQQQQPAPNVHERPSASTSRESQQQQPAPNVHERPSASTSRESQQQHQPAPNVSERLFPAIKERRKDDSSSDDSSSDDES